ncbi:MAG: glycosyltransferase [Rhizonema sp. PD38]|nr:glycosyltransferase [Rhizonema sp. PD38]
MSHCGMNSINEALYWGKPILGLPLFGDQHYNAARIVDLGAALKLDKQYFDSDEVRRKINEIFSNISYTEATHLIWVLMKSTLRVDKAADIVENTLIHKKQEVGNAKQ